MELIFCQFSTVNCLTIIVIIYNTDLSANWLFMLATAVGISFLKAFDLVSVIPSLLESVFAWRSGNFSLTL
jgi:hypothetical protein